MHVVYHDTFFLQHRFATRPKTRTTCCMEEIMPTHVALNSNDISFAPRPTHTGPTLERMHRCPHHCQTPSLRPPHPKKLFPNHSSFSFFSSSPLSPTRVSPTYATGHTSAPAPPTETCRVVPPPSGATNDFSNCPVWQSRNPTFWPP